AVVLGAGEYEIAGTVTIATSGIVLRGENGAVVRLTGKPHRLLDIHGAGTWSTEGAAVPIVDDYVASGTATFRLHSAAGFHAGDRVLIQRPVSQEWIHLMGMDTLVRDGKPQTWIKAGTIIRTDRVIKSVANNRITLDVPLSDALEAKYGR